MDGSVSFPVTSTNTRKPTRRESDTGAGATSPSLGRFVGVKETHVDWVSGLRARELRRPPKFDGIIDGGQLEGNGGFRPPAA